MMHSKLLLPFFKSSLLLFLDSVPAVVLGITFADAVAASLAVDVALVCILSCSGCYCFPLFSFSFFSFIDVAVACSFCLHR
jgi:hypothetical protein